MPFDDPASLGSEDKQLITRYLMWRHGSIDVPALEPPWDGRTPVW